MCLIAFALGTDSRYRLVLAGNRDEFHDRPAQGLQWWADAPDIAAGRDLQAGGTWLGVHRQGRVAAITNVREPARAAPSGREPSRGDLARGFLDATSVPLTHARALAADRRAPLEAYRGFNLLMFAATPEGTLEGAWLSNHRREACALAPGIYGLSNHLLDTPWPKVVALKRSLASALEDTRRDDMIERLFTALADPQPAHDGCLPATGLPYARERLLSAAFVDDPTYGTRASSVLVIDADGEVSFDERSWSPQGPIAGPIAQRRIRFRLA
jgi:uncharacterized protein with NRDE domain